MNEENTTTANAATNTATSDASQPPRAGRRSAAPEPPAPETQSFHALATVVTGAGVFAPGALVPLTRREWEEMRAAGAISGEWPND